MRNAFDIAETQSSSPTGARRHRHSPLLARSLEAHKEGAIAVNTWPASDQVSDGNFAFRGLSSQVTSRVVMKALVVEDDVELGRALVRALEEWGAATTLAETVEAATRLVANVELVVLDIGLPDGSGVTVAEKAAALRPAPLIIAFSGNATAEEAFRLGQLGVRGYLTKPLSLGDFTATVAALLEGAPNLAPFLVATVGREPFQKVLAGVRRTMAEQALARTGGNRTGAARLLGVTRQAVQNIIRDLDIETDDY